MIESRQFAEEHKNNDRKSKAKIFIKPYAVNNKYQAVENHFRLTFLILAWQTFFFSKLERWKHSKR